MSDFADLESYLSRRQEPGPTFADLESYLSKRAGADPSVEAELSRARQAGYLTGSTVHDQAYRDYIEAHRDDPASAIARLNTAQFFSDREGIPFRDALANVDTISKAWYGQAATPITAFGAIDNGWKQAWSDYELGILYSKKGAGTAEPEDLARIVELEESLPPPDKYQRWLPTQMLVGAAQSIPYTASAIAGSLAGDLAVKGLASLVFPEGSLAIAGIQLFGKMLTARKVVNTAKLVERAAAVAGEAGGAAANYEAMAGLEFRDMVKAGMDPAVAWPHAQWSGALQSAVEAVAGAGYLPTALAKSSLLAAAERVIGEGLLKGRYRAPLMKLAGRTALGMGVEGSTEAAQQVVSEMAFEMARQASNSEGGRQVDPKTWEEVRTAIVDNFKMGALASIPLRAPGEVVNVAHDAVSWKAYLASERDKATAKKAEASTADAALAAAEASPDPSLAKKPSGEVDPVHAWRDPDSQNLYTEFRSLGPGPEGTTRAVLKFGDPTTRELYGFLEADVAQDHIDVTGLAHDRPSPEDAPAPDAQEGPGNASTVSPASSSAEGPAGAAEAPGTEIPLAMKGLFKEAAVELMAQHPGMDIRWSARGQVAEEIRDELIAENPRGEAFGLQWFDAKGNAGTVRTAIALRRKLYADRREIGLAEPGKVDLAMKIAEAYAGSVGLGLDEYIPSAFAEGVYRKGFDGLAGVDKKAAQGIRGATSFEKSLGDLTVALMHFSTKADLSTFLHELTHAHINFLRANKGRSEAIDAQLAAIKKAFGVGDWKAVSTKWTQEFKAKAEERGWDLSNEEVVAYAVEDFLRTRELPADPAAAGLIQKIAAWIVDVYKALRGLRVQLTPEIEEVLGGILGDAGHPVHQGLKDSAAAQESRPEVLHQYAGEKAELSAEERADLDVAKEMDAAGKDTETIRLATGWFKGKYDGKWRIETDPRLAFKKPWGDRWDALENLIVYPGLFRKYPQLRRLLTHFEKTGSDPAMKGAYSRATDGDSLYKGKEAQLDVYAPGAEGAKRTLHHELQHAIQDIEGFSRGSTPKQFREEYHQLQAQVREIFEAMRQAARDGNKEEYARLMAERQKYIPRINELAGRSGIVGLDMYTNTAGEIEARDVQARMGLSPESRRATAPYSSEDIAAKDAVVLFQPEMDSFSEKLDQYEKGKLASNEIITVSMPHGILSRFLPGLPIVTKQSVLRKAREKHGIELTEIRALPLLLAYPTFVFHGSHDGSIAVITGAKDTAGRNVLAAIEIDSSITPTENRNLEVSEITSLHGKDFEKILNWFGSDKLKWADKNKGLEWLAPLPRSNSGRAGQTQGLIDKAYAEILAKSSDPDTLLQPALESARDFATWEEFRDAVEATWSWMGDEHAPEDLPPAEKDAWYKRVWEEAHASTGTNGGLAEEPAADPLASFVEELRKPGALEAFLLDLGMVGENAKSYEHGGAQDEEEFAEMERTMELRDTIRREVHPLVLNTASGVARSGRAYVKPSTRSAILSIVEHGSLDYAALAAEVRGDAGLKAAAALALGKRERDFGRLKDPRAGKWEDLSISDRARLADRFRNEETRRKIRSGDISGDEIKQLVDSLDEELKAAEAERAGLEKEIASQDFTLTRQEILYERLRAEAKEKEREIVRLNREIARAEERQAKLGTALADEKADAKAQDERLLFHKRWLKASIAEKHRLEAELAAAGRSAAEIAEYTKGQKTASDDRLLFHKQWLRTAIQDKQRAEKALAATRAELRRVRETDRVRQREAVRSAVEKLKVRVREIEARKKAARELRETKLRLADRIMKEASWKTVNWAEVKQIRAIQSMIDPRFRRPDTWKIEWNGRSWTKDEFDQFAEANPELVKGAIGEKWYIRLQKKGLDELTVEELEELADKVEALAAQGRSVLRARDELFRYNAAVTRNKGTETLDASGKFEDPGVYGSKGWNEAIRKRSGLALGKFDQMDDRHFAMVLDNMKDGGVHARELVERERDCRRKETEIVERMANPVVDFMQAHRIDIATLANTYVKVDPQNVKIGEGGPVELSKEALMFARLALRDEDSRKALIGGNFFNPEFRARFSAEEESGQVSDSTRRILDHYASRIERQINSAIESSLSEDEKALADLMASILDVSFDQFQEAFVVTFNHEMRKVKYYVPIRRQGSTYESLEGEVLEEFKTSRGMVTNPNKGATVERIKIGWTHQKPIKTDLFGIYFDAVKKQAHLIAYADYIKEMNQVFKSPRAENYRYHLALTHGREAVERLDKLISSAANPDQFKVYAGSDRIIRFLRGSLASGYLGFRPATALKQLLTSWEPFLPHTGAYLAGSAATAMGKGPWNFVRETEAKSAILRTRSTSEAAAMLKAGRHEGMQGKLQAFGDRSFKLIEWADRYCVAVGWDAVYRKALAEGIDDAAAVRKADDVVLLTQPSGAQQDLAPFFKEGGEAMKILTQFMSPLSRVYQNWRYDVPAAFLNGRAGEGVAIILSYMLTGALLYAVLGNHDPDDPDKEIRSWILSAFSQVTDSVPLIGSYVSELSRVAVTGKGGGMVSSDPLPAVSRAFQGATKITKGALEGSWDEIAKGMQAGVEGAGLMAGFPVSAVKDVIRATEEGPGALLGRRKE